MEFLQASIEDDRIWERWGRDVSSDTQVVDWVLIDEPEDLGD